MLLVSLIVSCKDDDDMDPVDEPNFITASGASVTLTGVWESGCVTDRDQNLSEILTFSGDEIDINIRFFDSESCSNEVGTQLVTIEYRVGGTFQAVLDGQTVLANEISGIFTDDDGDSENFRQAIYVDDSGTELMMYHARFGDDGGDLNADGFPTDIIPIPISRR